MGCCYSIAEILHEAEELWQRQSNCTGSDSGSEVGSVSSGTTADINDHYIHASRLVAAANARRSTPSPSHYSASSSSHNAPHSPSHYLPQATSAIHGNRIGPTIITVNGVSSSAAGQHNLDSMLYTSMDEPLQSATASVGSCNGGGSGHHPFLNLYQAAPAAAAAAQAPIPTIMSPSDNDVIDDVIIYDEAVDLEPIDFEHFVDEPEMGGGKTTRNNRSAGSELFKVSSSPAAQQPRRV